MPIPQMTLCLAVTDPQRMVATVKVCAVLGMCDIVRIITERVDAADVEYWESIETNGDSAVGLKLESDRISSTEDSHAATPMLEAIAALIRAGAAVIVLWEEASRPTLAELFESLDLVPSSVERVALVIGPRLGLSRTEVADAVSLGAHTATIGSTVVGNHVAAIAGLMAVHHVTRS